MQYVEQHLTKHHLFHAPHRWFFALLLSPIHAAELHYQHRYHLQYGHAKKLFVFDLSLVAFAIFLFGATIFWATYNPTVTDKIQLAIAPAPHEDAETPKKTKSGDHASFAIPYKNASDVKLTDAQLTIDLPAGFIILETEPANIFTDHTRTFSLHDIAPGASGTVLISGLFYGIPDQEQPIIARLSYVQEGNTRRETKTVRLLATLRDSVIVPSFTTANAQQTSPLTVFSQGSIPVQFSLQNPYHHDIPSVSAILPSQVGASLQDIHVSTGSIEKNLWTIGTMTAGQTATATAILTFSLAPETTNLTLTFMPQVTVNAVVFTQTPAHLPFEVRAPNVNLIANWTGETGTITPGNTVALQLTMKNNSDMVMTDPHISLPVDTNIIDTSHLTGFKNGILTLRPTAQPTLNRLQPGEDATLTVTLPIRSFINVGEKLSLLLTPTLIGQFPNIAAPFETKATLTERLISTSFQFAAESRYYTDEGDQLGRGPLPPHIDKETKYWALITLTNGTNPAGNTIITATIPPGVTATGKKSITTGKDVTIDNTTRNIRWAIPILAPHEEAGLYIELSVTPNESQRGAVIPLLTNIKTQGKDDVTQATIAASAPSIDTSLPKDEIAQSKGTLVQ